MQVQAVLFDLGGTLFTYERREELARATSDALVRLGLDPADPAVREARRRAAELVEREYAAQPSFLHRDLFRDRVARTAELLGVHPSEAVLDQFDVEHRQAIIEHLTPQPDAADTLQGLRDRGVYTSIVSNADDDYLVAMLDRHGLDALLDDWTSSEEAASCKPDRRIYEVALAKAGSTPASTLFVGDSLEHDVAGARAMGMRTVLIGEPGTKAPLSTGLDAPEPADFEIRRLAEVLAIVDAANGAA